MNNSKRCPVEHVELKDDSHVFNDFCASLSIGWFKGMIIGTSHDLSWENLWFPGESKSPRSMWCLQQSPRIRGFSSSHSCDCMCVYIYIYTYT